MAIRLTASEPILVVSMPGVIGGRLSALYAKVRPEITLPVIIITENAPDSAIVQAIEREAGNSVSFRSALGHVVGTSLTMDAAQRVARLPGVVHIHYDEPIVSIRGIFSGFFGG